MQTFTLSATGQIHCGVAASSANRFTLNKIEWALLIAPDFWEELIVPNRENELREVEF